MTRLLGPQRGLLLVCALLALSSCLAHAETLAGELVPSEPSTRLRGLAQVEPPVFVDCETTKGTFTLRVEPSWAPIGAARFLELVEDENFFKDLPMFRCVNNFLCQNGARTPLKEGSRRRWAAVPDDPEETRQRVFQRGFLSFAGSGPNSRSTHFFITLGKKVSSLGREVWESPFGYVESGPLEALETGYGDMPPWGTGPDPGKIESKSFGVEYLQQNFPKLDYWKSCKRRRPVSVLELELGPNLGRVSVELRPDWAPLGVQRMKELVTSGFFTQACIFRVVPGFVAQLGLPADPSMFPESRYPFMKDDPVRHPNKRGTVAFASAGPDTRTTQIFINFNDNEQLDGMGFAPFGFVTAGMNFVDDINAEYRERPDQGKITRQGNAYLDAQFPRLSRVLEARIVEVDSSPSRSSGSQAGAASQVHAEDGIQLPRYAPLTKGATMIPIVIAGVLIAILLSLSAGRWIAKYSRRKD